MTDTQPIKIDIWSDIACPWCYIGKRHLEDALGQLGAAAEKVQVEYHSFELAPDTPEDFQGSEIDFLVANKGMERAAVEQMLEQVTARATAAGLDYDFDKLRHRKTIKAHQLLHYAKTQGLQTELKERLLAAYFTEGGDISDHDALVGFAQDVGLDGDAARAVLEEQRFLSEVQADMEMAQKFGISGVPFYVIDQKYGISGGQPAEIFVQAIQQVAQERQES